MEKLVKVKMISKYFKILGWTLLIINIWGFLISFNFNGIIYLSDSIRPYGVIFYSITLILYLLQFIASIFLLRLNEWARKAIILLTFLNIFLLFAQPIIVGKPFFLTTDDYVKQYQSSLSAEQKLNYQKLETVLAQKSHHPITVERRERVNRIASNMYLPSFIFFTAWYLFIIFYLNRSSIKEQFFNPN